MKNHTLVSFGVPLDLGGLANISAAVQTVFPTQFDIETKTLHMPIQGIKRAMTKDAFLVFCGYHIIGGYLNGGWWVGVFGNAPEYIPFTVDFLKTIGQDDMAIRIDKIIALFPQNTDFYTHDQNFTDTINLMQGLWQHVHNKEHFCQYSLSDRITLKKGVKKQISILEGLSEKTWPYNTSWDGLLAYANAHGEKTLWVE